MCVPCGGGSFHSELKDMETSCHASQTKWYIWCRPQIYKTFCQRISAVRRMQEMGWDLAFLLPGSMQSYPQSCFHFTATFVLIMPQLMKCYRRMCCTLPTLAVGWGVHWWTLGGQCPPRHITVGPTGLRMVVHFLLPISTWEKCNWSKKVLAVHNCNLRIPM